MKFFRHIFVLAVLLTVSMVLSAQSPYSWDSDIRQIRNNMMPGFSCKADDYVQYAPGVVTFGMKACGYKSRTGWGRMLVADAFSYATMGAVLNTLKYTVKRPRPEGTARNSFPSGHTATSFMMAGWMHHEYGWRSPWWSIGGYSVATLTSLSRIANNRHWMSDTFAGALIGVGSVELGYFLSDLIFKDKYLNPDYVKPEFHYCSEEHGYYSVGLQYSRRFIMAPKDLKEGAVMPFRGSDVALNVEIPLLAGSGVCVRADAGSLLFRDVTQPDGTLSSTPSFNVYSGQVGMFWERDFAAVLELEVQAMIGYAGHRQGGGIDVSAGASLNLITGNNFKLRALAEWETFSYASRNDSIGRPYLNSILLGYSAAFYW